MTKKKRDFFLTKKKQKEITPLDIASFSWELTQNKNFFCRKKTIQFLCASKQLFSLFCSVFDTFFVSYKVLNLSH